ncbi:MAG: ATP-binding cassette domain-containing protein [Solirubrobacterales bacterium]|nr:ATP-binding cassette domain-containing protein [Solirubrobacterales bacterium]
MSSRQAAPNGPGRPEAQPRICPEVSSHNRDVSFELSDVHLARAGRQVLDGLSAEIPDGVCALVGPSGSGKSTVLRLLNRLADPDSGTVLYEGTSVRERDPLALRKEVCLVPQLPALLPGTVATNIHFAAGLADRRPDVDALLGHAGLDPAFAERDVSKLSVGEQQRAMLARALALEPRVLLLDEPTSALDEEARGAIERTIGRLAADLDVSIVVVTHDLDQARRLVKWVIRVEGGRAIGAGPADEQLVVAG